jgi:cobalamin biosynthetic protein CobC
MVDASSWTYHGGGLADAAAAYGGAVERWIDLSTGINPNGWPGTADCRIDWRALPDRIALADLEAAAAAHFGVDSDQLCALPGTEIGLRLLGGILPGPVSRVEPGYRTHAKMFRDNRPIAAEDIDGVSDSTILLANPNNPDGRATAPDTLLEALRRLSASSHWLVVDEAFADAMPDISLARDVHDDRRLILFRSFGKFFGLAGVRLGFVLGPRSVIASFRAKLGSWPVSAAALDIGTSAYLDHDWIAGMRVSLRVDAELLDGILARHGFAPIGNCPLFRLIETEDGFALFDRLARQSILTRPFDYNPRWLRIGLPADDAARMRLDRALGNG